MPAKQFPFGFYLSEMDVHLVVFRMVWGSISHH